VPPCIRHCTRVPQQTRIRCRITRRQLFLTRAYLRVTCFTFNIWFTFPHFLTHSSHFPYWLDRRNANVPASTFCPTMRFLHHGIGAPWCFRRHHPSSSDISDLILQVHYKNFQFFFYENITMYHSCKILPPRSKISDPSPRQVEVLNLPSLTRNMITDTNNILYKNAHKSIFLIMIIILFISISTFFSSLVNVHKPFTLVKVIILLGHERSLRDRPHRG